MIDPAPICMGIVDNSVLKSIIYQYITGGNTNQGTVAAEEKVCYNADSKDEQMRRNGYEDHGH